MSYFSFVDTTFKRIHFNIDSNLNDESKSNIHKFLKLIEGSNRQKAELMDYLRNETSKNDMGFWILHAHEYCHFLQTFYYPYLYLISYFQYKALMRLPIQIRETNEDIEIDKIWFTKEINGNFQLSSHKVSFYWEGNELVVNDDPDERIDINRRLFSINDFVENAASIFQFQVLTDNKSDYNDYHEWITNPSNKVYKNVYLFLEKKVGKALAFNMLKKIPQIMFRTTDPIPVFVALVNYWIENHLSEYDLKIEYLEALVEYSICQNHSVINIEGLFSVLELPEQKYIGMEEFQNLLSQTEEYPLSHLIKTFIDKKDVYNQYNKSLLDVDRESFFKLYYNDFKPHLVQYYFRDVEGIIKPILELCDDYFSIDVTVNKTKIGNFYYALYFQMRIADISFEIIHNKSNDLVPMNCSIRECPYYQIKLCRTWKSTPKKYSDCTFPIFFKLIYKKEIDAKNRTLLNIDINENDLEKEYKIKLDLHNQIARINYTILEDRITLDVPIDELDNDAGDYFNSFIKLLFEQTDYNYKSLFNKVFIQFMGFEKDKREIYEIQKIVDWVSNLKKQIPELFYYLNWDINRLSKPPKTQPTVILPIFLKYNKLESGFQFTENVYEFLTKKQIDYLIAFCIDKGLDPKKTISLYINNIIDNLNLAYGN
jgi:hypothetical protein